MAYSFLMLGNVDFYVSFIVGFLKLVPKAPEKLPVGNRNGHSLYTHN